ncbi:MAG: YggT family protein [Desulfovibrio sp.]|nr:YggT family protein [Desulfovibrio sp.]
MLLLANTLYAISVVLGYLLNIYFWIVIVAAVMTWFNPDPYNFLVRALRMLTEPLFYRIRKWMPFTYLKGLDFSAVIVLIAIQLTQMIVVKTLAEWAARLGAR